MRSDTQNTWVFLGILAAIAAGFLTLLWAVVWTQGGAPRCYDHASQLDTIHNVFLEPRTAIYRDQVEVFRFLQEPMAYTCEWDGEDRVWLSLLDETLVYRQQSDGWVEHHWTPAGAEAEAMATAYCEHGTLQEPIPPSYMSDFAKRRWVATFEKSHSGKCAPP